MKTTIKPIGTKCYCFHKNYLNNNLDTVIMVGIVNSYQRIGGKINPLITLKNNRKAIINNDNYKIYYKIEDAIKNLKVNRKNVLTSNIQ